MTNATRALFAPLKVGAMELKHRVVMAPLTRLRSDLPGDVPNDLMAEYYGQRASEGGLLIAEATAIAVTGRGYLGAPGIYNDEQVTGWQKVTKAVHAKGGKIYLQLWHVGRTGHAELMEGAAPVSASVTPYEGVSFTSQGWVRVSPHRALRVEEIPALVESYRHATLRAEAAGFDGVEIHAANGYLIDQFLQDGSNKRTDLYGGSVENRARFLLEIVKASVSVRGADSVAVRLAPSGSFNGMWDSDPQATFSYVTEMLNAFDLAYLHVVEPRIKGSDEIEAGMPALAAASLKPLFKGPLLAAGGFDPESGAEIVETGNADMVAFGRLFISNPDLPMRIEKGWALTPYDRSTFYASGPEGYTDYPMHTVGSLT